MKKMPQLTGWENGDRVHIIVWCKYCKRYHWHGLGGGNGEGHRVAHCVLKTPYRATGYEIIPVGSAPAYILKDLKLTKPKGPLHERKEKIYKPTPFAAFIKKQQFRNDPLGDYARDFKSILDNLPIPECRGTDEIESETLYGHYSFLPDYAKNTDCILEALCSLWREWLEYKHIGLKYGPPKRGYIYILKLKNEDHVFKIGRTLKKPEKRLLEVARQEKADVILHDWIQINFYDIIEKELHTIFKKNQIMREWFKLDRKDLEEVIHIYSLTDSTCIINSTQEYENDDSFICPEL